MKQKPETLKVGEVAAKLRVDPRTVYRMIELGDLPAVRVGRLFRIPAEAIEKLMYGRQRIT
jgi:excisionase family DNA binding protein